MTLTDGTLRPATSADVARLAGVSRSTVSSILNGNAERFPETTRQRVRDAALQLRYRPSPAGRSLVSGRSDLIVILVPATGFGANLQEAAEAVTARVVPMNASVVIRFAGPTAASTIDGIQALRPLAVIHFGGLSRDDVETLEGFGTIVVPKLDAPGFDGEEVADSLVRLQADALLSAGPRALWYANSTTRPDPFGLHRAAELRRYCRQLGIPAPREIDIPLDIDGAKDALRSALLADARTGFACYNDDVALAILAAARELNASVPEQVAVVGLDYTIAGRLWSPRLTSIRVDIVALVHSLTDQIEALLDGRTTWDAPGSIYELMPGSST